MDCSARGGGSETESEAAALDKDYWIRRAGEVSSNFTLDMDLLL